MSTANFIVIQDGTSTIQDNSLSHPDHVELPQFGATDANLALRPVLTFKAIPAGDVTLTITLNGSDVLTKTFSSGSERMLSEVVNENILQANVNEVIVSATGSAQISLSDLVLWYRK